MSKKLTVRDLFIRFKKATEETRSGAPVHSPLTKFKGKSFLNIVMQFYGVDKEKAIEMINKELISVPYTVRTKNGKKIPGFLLFLPEESKARKKPETTNAIDDLLRIKV